jgi:hypothetical protein
LGVGVPRFRTVQKRDLRRKGDELSIASSKLRRAVLLGGQLAAVPLCVDANRWELVNAEYGSETRAGGYTYVRVN